jgi:transferase CAF17, mitochondrial
MTAMIQKTIVHGHYGRLWGRGYEVLTAGGGASGAAAGPAAAGHGRVVLRVQGSDATKFLQNLVTANLTAPPIIPMPEPIDAVLPGVPKYVQDQMRQENHAIEFAPYLRAACFLDLRGRIVTDALLWQANESTYYVDIASDAGDILLHHLQQYKLRRTKVAIDDVSSDHPVSIIYGTLATNGTPPPGMLTGLDPRHPSLGLRVLTIPEQAGGSGTSAPLSLADILDPTVFPHMPGNYLFVRRLAGVLEGATELANRTALETNHEFLSAISFDKGCYLGQELTARVHYTGVVRKRAMPILLLDPNTQIPEAWSLASSLQTGRQLKRFTSDELRHLPSRLPRLSVATAGNMVAVTTAALEPETAAVDESAAQEWRAIQQKTNRWLDETVAVHVTMGAKITDAATGETVGQILSPPLPGTNLVIGLMRLEQVGLLSPGAWSKTNKVKIGDAEFRYLPYLPLWWPEIDNATGKAKINNDHYDDDEAAHEPPSADAAEAETTTSSASSDDPDSTPRGMTRVEIEEIPLREEPPKL